MSVGANRMAARAEIFSTSSFWERLTGSFFAAALRRIGT
jgi:hypothetical protein